MQAHQRGDDPRRPPPGGRPPRPPQRGRPQEGCYGPPPLLPAIPRLRVPPHLQLQKGALSTLIKVCD